MGTIGLLSAANITCLLKQKVKTGEETIKGAYVEVKAERI